MRVKSILKRLKVINDLYTKYKWREREVSLGKQYPETIFYVARRAKSSVGLFSYVTDFMGDICYAIENGYVPVIDMQNVENTYLEKSEVGLVNSWEFFFLQPSGYSLEDIKTAKKVILGNGLHKKNFRYPSYDITNNEDEYLFWKSFSQKYIHIRPEILIDSQKKYNNMFGSERVLGVLSRGTDYATKKPSLHPVQPSIEELIIKVKEMKQKNKCKFIYLATEDELHYIRFKEVFGDILFVSEARRCINENVQYINEVSYDREHDRYLKGYEYLMNILLLTQCSCFVGAPNGGTYGTLLLGNGFEDQFIFDLGCYK